MRSSANLLGDASGLSHAAASEDARLRRRLRRDRLVQLSQVAVTLLVGVLFYFYMERKPCDAANEEAARREFPVKVAEFLSRVSAELGTTAQKRTTR